MVSKRVVLADVPPERKTGTRVRSDVPSERKTGTRVRLHVPPERKPERGYILGVATPAEPRGETNKKCAKFGR